MERDECGVEYIDEKKPRLLNCWTWEVGGGKEIETIGSGSGIFLSLCLGAAYLHDPNYSKPCCKIFSLLFQSFFWGTCDFYGRVWVCVFKKKGEYVLLGKDWKIHPVLWKQERAIFYSLQ